MKIEVVTNKNDSTKDKGDLLESISQKLLSAQSYGVVDQIRLTGVELDLLCRHKVSNKEIYVECKAHRDNLDANVLKNLAGTLLLKGIDEGWLISTSELGKEAKGLQYEWKRKPDKERKTLSIYTPTDVLEALIDAHVVSRPPVASLGTIIPDRNCIGEWMLLISRLGYFWAITKLSGGMPAEVFLFHAKDGAIVDDASIISSIASTDTSLNGLKFQSPTKIDRFRTENTLKVIDVIQLQHGDSWDDYRPARAEDFVGRQKSIDKIFSLFSSVRKNESSTRVFALTGNSGMGKSSLINKLRDKSTNKHHKDRLFVFAVDLRAATSPDYVYSSLLACFRAAQEKGFGDSSISLRITDLTDPLESPEIKEYVLSLARCDQVVCLVFDQFEELSAKPDLFAVFDKAKALFLGTNALQSNFCMGFAWKSDITVSGDNPAYYMWHELEDLRLTYVLHPFTDGESKAALNIFEKVIGQKLHSDLRHNLLVISQGYPWLLKKLFIHLHSKIEQGFNQDQLIENKLDVGKLFDDDLQRLTSTESACLTSIAKQAPVDLGAVIELYDEQTITNLIYRRLVVKSGDRLSIYWDIFREYLLTNKVPEIPLHYLPTNEFNSVFSVGRLLLHGNPKSVTELALEIGFSEKTVMNILSDLIMFEIAERDQGKLTLRPDLIELSEESILLKARHKLQRHAFTIVLHEQYPNTEISIEEAIELLKEVYPNETFAPKTWRTYTLRLCRWLEVTGLLVQKGWSWGVRDLNRINVHVARRRRTSNGRSRREIFTAPAPPDGTIKALECLIVEKRIPKSSGIASEYRNAISILKRLELVSGGNDTLTPDITKIEQQGGATEAIWKAAENLATLAEAVELIREKPNLSGYELGDYFNRKYALRWTDSSKMRNGNGIRRWAEWLVGGIPLKVPRPRRNPNLLNAPRFDFGE